jgi:hypothetical protein
VPHRPSLCLEVFSLHRHVGPDSLAALDACRMALGFCATLGIHTPSFGEAATWNHDVLVQQKQEECKKVCSARCLSAPIGQAGKGTCEKRMTLRNWRLVSHDVGQNSRHPPRGCMGRMRSRKAGWTAVIGHRGAEAQNGRITSSAQCLFFFFFFWLFENFTSTTWKPEFGEQMRCFSGLGLGGLGETMCHFGIYF